MPSRETGQSLVPDPPARSTGVICGLDIEMTFVPNAYDRINTAAIAQGEAVQSLGRLWYLSGSKGSSRANLLGEARCGRRLFARLGDAGADLRNVEIDDFVGHVFHGEPLGDDLLQGGGALEERLWTGQKST